MVNAYQTCENLVRYIQQYCFNRNCHKIVIEIDGSIEKQVAATLCARALGSENVFAVIDGTVGIGWKAIKFCEDLNIAYRIISLQEVRENFLDCVSMGYTEEEDTDVLGLLKYAALNYYAQAMNALICNPDSELQHYNFNLFYGNTYDEICELAKIFNLPTT